MEHRTAVEVDAVFTANFAEDTVRLVHPQHCLGRFVSGHIAFGTELD